MESDGAAAQDAGDGKIAVAGLDVAKLCVELTGGPPVLIDTGFLPGMGLRLPDTA